MLIPACVVHRRAALQWGPMISPLLLVTLCCTAIGAGANVHPSFGHGSHKQEGRHSKWIVVTTVNYPTETIQRLATVPGWRLVVVADLKTPADWDLPNVELLTVERQKTLNYKILPLLPNNHYGWGTPPAVRPAG